MSFLVRIEKWIDYFANNTAAIDFFFFYTTASITTDEHSFEKDFQNKLSSILSAHRI